MNKHKAMAYIYLLMGTLAVNGLCDDLINACINFHLVTPDDTIPIYGYSCNCKGFFHKVEYSHVVAAAHLEKKLMCSKNLQRFRVQLL